MKPSFRPLLCLLLAVHLVFAGQLSAQVYTGALHLKGRALTIEKTAYTNIATQDTAVPLYNATVQLFSLPDSVFTIGAISNKEGKFRLFHIRKRQGTNRFLLKVSYLGMGTYQREVSVSMKDREVDLGDITLRPKTMTMQEAQIVGELKKMYMKGDTLIYNTDAYKMPKGSVLLELVRRLPGLYFSGTGTLMYLNKPICEIRLNGEGFFTHDLNIALKNVPVKELDQVKVYETVTEEDKLRGGKQKKQVMDMKTKQEVNRTVLANISAGIANRDSRYLADGGINYFKKRGTQIALNGHTLNLPGGYDPEQSNMPPAFMNENSKEWTRKKIHLNWKQGFKGISVNEDLSHTYNNRINETTTSSENYLSNSSLFTEQQNRNANRETGIHSRSILMSRIGGASLLFIGSINDIHNQGITQQTSASFNRNPYEYSDQPLDTDEAQATSICTNRMQQQSLQQSHRKSADGGLSINKFGFGSTYLVNLNVSYSENENSSLMQNHTRFFQLDSIVNRHQYVCTPSRQTKLNAEFRYGFRIRQIHNIELSYVLKYQTEEQNRSIYDLNRLSAGMEWDIIPSAYATTLVDSVSRKADIRGTDHTLKVSYNGRINSNLNFSVEAAFLPKHIHATTATPSNTIADIGYDFLNWDTKSNLEYRAGLSHYTLAYSGNSHEPSINDLLPITNDDNPLFITSGNPKLKKSVEHNLSLFYRNGFAWNASLSASRTDNAVTTQTVYNELTGVRSTKPANIDGNWNVYAELDYKTTWKDFTLLCHANCHYSNEARYVQNMLVNSPNEKSNIRQQQGSLKADFRYTPQKIEIGMIAQCDIARTHNELSDIKLFTRDYKVTGEFRAYLPTDIDFNTSFAYRLRRGYNFTSANMNEGIWNVGVRYKFLKEKTASIRLECFDLLKQQKSITYFSSVSGNSETRVKCVNRYILLTFSYRFNVFT